MKSFGGLNLDDDLEREVNKIKTAVRTQILKTDIELLFKDWDYQTKSVDDYDKIISEMYSAAESCFFIAPVNYQSRFKNFFGLMISYIKWVIYQKVLLRFMFPFVSSDFQFKLRVIKLFDLIKRRK